jgi:hypothetical protein
VTPLFVGALAPTALLDVKRAVTHSVFRSSSAAVFLCRLYLYLYCRRLDAHQVAIDHVQAVRQLWPYKGSYRFG